MSNQERANALVEQANTLHNAGKKLEAAPMYVEAATLFEPYASFALVAGDSYSAAERDDEAIAAYRACVAAIPDHEDAWEGLGAVLLRTGQQELAREAYANAKKPFPGDAKPGLLKRWFGIG